MILKNLKFITFLLSVLFITGCQDFNLFSGNNKDENTPVKYTSAGNDIAEVQLNLNPNNRFKLVYEDPETGDSKVYKGKWEEKKDYYHLNFKRKVDVMELFPPKMTPPKNVIIIDDQTIKFKKNKSAIWIWGIYCAKIK